ncbi:MAG: radical SAM protein [Butyrivibrio sp.]|nr:radical SAM protein [Butyrivibrio sp.]
MKVLLVKPEFKNVFTKLSLIRTEPLELEYLSAICKNRGVESRICDLTVRGKSLKSVLKSFGPDIVAFTANFVHIYAVKKYVSIVKRYKASILTVVGGPHAEVMPEDFMFDGLDVIIHSGGFKPFEDILEAEGAEAYGDIKGISYFDGSEWHKNERQIFDAGALPFPDREHFYRNIKKYKYVTMKPCAILKASYSCPHNCNYCFSTLLNGGKYLCRAPENVVEEIKGIKCDNIWIVDDTFYVDKAKLDEFIRLVGEEGIDKKYSLYFRADFIAANPDYMKRLADIGVTMCAVGLEVIDDGVLEKYNKNSSVNIILRALEVLKESNITCIGLFMIDIDADKSYFKKLYEFIKKYELYLSTISILTPMPGTGQFEKYKDRIVTDDYRKWDFVHLTITPTKMSRFTFYKEFYKLYVKLAMLILKKRLLSFSYLGSAISASFDYWFGVLGSLFGRKK